MPQIFWREIRGMSGTVENVLDRIGVKAAFRAVVVHHFADAELEVLQLRAVAGP